LWAIALEEGYDFATRRNVQFGFQLFERFGDWLLSMQKQTIATRE